MLSKVKSSLETVHEIVNLFRNHLETRCSNLKQELAADIPGIRVLCPTRWTVASLQSVLDNNEVILALLE